MVRTCLKKRKRERIGRGEGSERSFHNFLKIPTLKKFIYFICMTVVPAFMSVHPLCTLEIRKGHKIPWYWS